MKLSRNSMSVITLFAEEPPGTKWFYQEVLGLQLLFESENQAVFKFANLVVNLTEAADPLELIARRPLPPGCRGTVPACHSGERRGRSVH